MLSHTTETISKASFTDDFVVVFKDIISQDSIVYISAILGLILTLTLFYNNVLVKFYNSWIKPMVSFFQSIIDLPSRFDKMETKIDDKLTEINKQFQVNGGSTVKDALNRLEGSIIKLATQTRKIDSRQWILLNTTNLAVFETDEFGGRTKISKKYLDLTGRDMDELLGMNWLNTVAYEDRERVKNEWKNSVEQKTNIDIVFTVISKTNKRIKIHCEAKPGFIEGTKDLIGYVGYWTEIKD